MKKVLVENLEDAVNIAWSFLDGVANGYDVRDVQKWVKGEMENVSFETEVGDEISK